jgi:hypothetical protein
VFIGSDARGVENTSELADFTTGCQPNCNITSELIARTPAGATAVPRSPGFAHKISLEDAKVLTHRFQRTHPGETLAFSIAANAIDRVLAAESTEMLNVYMGEYEDRARSLVFIGSDVNGNENNSELADFTTGCPSICNVGSALIAR